MPVIKNTYEKAKKRGRRKKLLPRKIYNKIKDDSPAVIFETLYADNYKKIKSLLPKDKENRPQKKGSAARGKNVATEIQIKPCFFNSSDSSLSFNSTFDALLKAPPLQPLKTCNRELRNVSVHNSSHGSNSTSSSVLSHSQDSPKVFRYFTRYKEKTIQNSCLEQEHNQLGTKSISSPLCERNSNNFTSIDNKKYDVDLSLKSTFENNSVKNTNLQTNASSTSEKIQGAFEERTVKSHANDMLDKENLNSSVFVLEKTADTEKPICTPMQHAHFRFSSTSTPVNLNLNEWQKMTSNEKVHATENNSRNEQTSNSDNEQKSRASILHKMSTPLRNSNNVSVVTANDIKCSSVCATSQVQDFTHSLCSSEDIFNSYEDKNFSKISLVNRTTDVEEPIHILHATKEPICHVSNITEEPISQSSELCKESSVSLETEHESCHKSESLSNGNSSAVSVNIKTRLTQFSVGDETSNSAANENTPLLSKNTPFVSNDSVKVLCLRSRNVTIRKKYQENVNFEYFYNDSVMSNVECSHVEKQEESCLSETSLDPCLALKRKITRGPLNFSKSDSSCSALSSNLDDSVQFLCTVNKLDKTTVDASRDKICVSLDCESKYSCSSEVSRSFKELENGQLNDSQNIVFCCDPNSSSLLSTNNLQYCTENPPVSPIADLSLLDESEPFLGFPDTDFADLSLLDESEPFLGFPDTDSIPRSPISIIKSDTQNKGISSSPSENKPLCISKKSETEKKSLDKQCNESDDNLADNTAESNGKTTEESEQFCGLEHIVDSGDCLNSNVPDCKIFSPFPIHVPAATRLSRVVNEKTIPDDKPDINMSAEQSFISRKRRRRRYTHCIVLDSTLSEAEVRGSSGLRDIVRQSMALSLTRASACSTVVENEEEEEEEIHDASGTDTVSLLDDSVFISEELSSVSICESVTSRRDTIPKDPICTSENNSIIEVTAESLILSKCDQEHPIPFSEAFSTRWLNKCKKIGEGTFAEVFCHQQGNKCSVLKVMPVEGNILVNGEPQKKFMEVLSEIVISMELSKLRYGEDNNTDRFSEVIRCLCVRGCYPPHLIRLWDEYAKLKGTENDSPTMFDDDQLYIIIELAHGGIDLEKYVFTTAEQSLAIFKQIAYALAVAESSFQFEHRDLHWGNVLVSETDNESIVFVLDGVEHFVRTEGVQVTIIDFTLSRMTYEGCVIFTDLSVDEALFEGIGDYQFDMYRMMRDELKNNWSLHAPRTNVFWLHYILSKLVKGVYYKKNKLKVHKTYLKKISQLYKTTLSSENVKDLVCNLLDL